jgi:hypothetical protein
VERLDAGRQLHQLRDDLRTELMVARFFLSQRTKTGTIYQISTKYIKWT